MRKDKIELYNSKLSELKRIQRIGLASDSEMPRWLPKVEKKIDRVEKRLEKENRKTEERALVL